MTQKRLSRKLIPISIILLACVCFAAVAGAFGYFFLFPRTAEARPVVQIIAPDHGTEVVIGRPVALHAVANDELKIERIEIWVGDQLLQAQDSALPGGTSPFPLVAYWQPDAAGPLTLTARAFNGDGVRAQSSIEVTAVDAIAASGDSDGDGVAEAEDVCPDQSGSPLALGCPDTDGDGLEDAADACPNEAGLEENDGCPLANDRDVDGIPDEFDECPDTAGTQPTDGCPDFDGDTIPDYADVCPTEPGGPGAPGGDGCPAPSDGDRDGDSLPDAEDACPDQGGSPLTEGCPDTDGDGVPDAEDACPAEPGLPGDDGCPVPGGGEDSDGDGVRDAEDACPDEPGPPHLNGCPEEVPGGGGDGGGDGGTGDGGGDEGAADSDGDGVLEDADLCPDEIGLPEHDGCPVPGDGTDDDGDGVPDDEGGPAEESGPTFPDMDLSSIMVGVEFQALSFQVSHDHDGIYCYPRMTGGGVERHVFEPLGAQQWDIAAELGSRTLALLPTEELQIDIECGGDVVSMGPEGGWGAYYNLGATSRSHPRSDWDGHVITVRSTGGDEGRWFEAQYRLCEGSCEDAALPPATISLFHFGGDDVLIIMWSGDREAIDGFWIYADGNRAFWVAADTTSLSIAGYEPLCGSGQREFYVTAYQGSRESPPSNIEGWNRQPCPRVVRVTFDTIETFGLADERRMDGQLGPIFGSFWVQGAESENLSYSGSDYPHGFKLSPFSTYSIQEMFDQIWVWDIQDSGPFYHAPDSSTVTVELGPYDDLTFGGVLYDQDWQVYQEVFNGSETLEAGDVVPGRYTIRDGSFELSVLIDVVVGPEAGDKPDLTITDVTEFGGQLRIHVFNNAASLENRDIEVNLVQISTNQSLGIHTWENVSIPSGGERILQSAELEMAPYDLRVIIDPDNKIDEMDVGNNIFETPVVMRFGFTGLRVPVWPCEGFLHQNAEIWFLLSVGYGPSWDDVTWLGHRLRYPETGVITWNRWDTPHPRYDLDGRAGFYFDFEMPAGENIYVYMTGYEQDGSTNDSMGYIEVVHPASSNYGAQENEHHARSEGRGATECDAVEPTVSYFGFDGWWHISRLH